MEIYEDLTDYCEALGIKLKKSGSVLRARCPFSGHKDNEPSFTVYEDTNTFYCFGCGVGGDAYQLAIHLGLEPPIILNQSNRRMERKYLDPSEAQIELMTRFCNTYSEDLPSNAREYLNKRGFTDKDIEKFGFGYCGYKAFDMSLQERKLAHLLGMTNDNGFITYWGYILIPEIRDEKVVWFQGRNFMSVGRKYLNVKLSVPLFGYNSIEGSKYAWITEGTFDALSLISEGEPAVALVGTNLQERFRDIFFGRIVKVCLDNDNAGQLASGKIKSTLKGITMFTVNVTLPDGTKDISELKEKGELKEWLGKK